MMGVKFMGIFEDAKNSARFLRRNETDAEKKLWQKLRNRNFSDLKFKRQHIIYFDYDNRKRFFIPDFYCADYKLIIELDGEIHDNQCQKEYDKIRENILSELGYKIMRFKNKNILLNIDNCLNHIKNFIEELV